MFNNDLYKATPQRKADTPLLKKYGGVGCYIATSFITIRSLKGFFKTCLQKVE